MPGEASTTLLKKIISECAVLIYSAGLLDQLSIDTRDFIASDFDIAQAMMTGEGPSLELRLSLDEYTDHVIKIFKPPQAQYEFYKVITKVCYLMLMAEKNPLIAQELKGVLKVSSILETLMRR